MVKSIYCVNFHVGNPPHHDEWESVDVALQELTGTINPISDFPDGESATYFFRENKEEAKRILGILKNRKKLGNFKISNVTIHTLIAADESLNWKKVPFKE